MGRRGLTIAFTDSRIWNGNGTAGGPITSLGHDNGAAKRNGEELRSKQHIKVPKKEMAVNSNQFGQRLHEKKSA